MDVQVRKICRFYAENASNRFNLLVEAFCAKGDMAAHNLITDARLLSKAGAKLIGSIKDKHASEKAVKELTFFNLCLSFCLKSNIDEVFSVNRKACSGRNLG